MGRSGNQKKLSLVHAKSRSLLLGDQEIDINGVSEVEVIVGDLKMVIDVRIRESSHDLLSREYFYGDILKELAQFDPKELVRDKTFQKILKHDARFLEKESRRSVGDDQIQKLAPAFANSIASGKMPNIGRHFFASPDIDLEMKKDFFNGYMVSLFSQRYNDYAFNEFIIRSVLPILEEVDDDMKAHGLLLLKDKVSFHRCQELEASKIFKDLAEEEGFLRTREETKVEKYSELFFIRCLDKPENNYSVEDLEGIILAAKTEAAIEAVFNKLLAGKDLGESGIRSVVTIDSRHEKLNYLNSILQDQGVFKRDRSDDVIKSIYSFLGGDDQQALKQVIKNRPFIAQEIYNSLEEAIKNGLDLKDHNYSADFLDRLNSLIN